MELVALPGLGGGMVDFEDSHAGMGVAVGEGIESGAEDNVLRDALGDGASEFVFGEAAAGGHEGAEGAGESVMLFGIGAEIICGFGADDAESERIVENFRVVEKLVRGAADGHSICGFAEFSWLHSV